MKTPIKRLFLLAVLFINSLSIFSQNIEEDSLLKVLAIQKTDTNIVNTLLSLVILYLNDFDENLDTLKVTKYLQKALTLSEKLNYKKGEAKCYYNFG